MFGPFLIFYLHFRSGKNKSLKRWPNSNESERKNGYVELSNNSKIGS